MINESFPKRSANHVIETRSYKIFSINIPDEWLIREMTERDYGVDLILELSGKHVYGDFISIQLKGIDGIKWNKDNYYNFSSVNKSTTNYWKNTQFPVFLILVDVKTAEVFFKPIKSYILQEYSRYINKDGFSYRFSNSEIFNEGSLNNFLSVYQSEKNIEKKNIEINNFPFLYQNFKEYVECNYGRDAHMLVDERERLLPLMNFYNNIYGLCLLLGFDWNIKTIESLVEDTPIGQYEDDIYEFHITKMLNQLDIKMTECLSKIKDIVLV